MTDTRPVTLGGRTFGVPPLPLRLNKLAYPLCRKLSGAGLIERIATSGGALDCTEDEMIDLAELAFLGAQAADKDIDRAAFEELPIKPTELLDAFFALRYQTGGWVVIAPKEGEDDAGEAKGAAKKPQK
jgi:hypothetical protein